MDLVKLPDNLPQPKNDRSCEHLLERIIPSTVLPSTKEKLFDICGVDSDFTILYFFPMMAISGKSLSSKWDKIPGARGCTPQNISINKHMKELQKYSATPIGISSQSIDELSKISSIRNFSQIILSDNSLKLQQKMDIPIFQFENKTMYKRLTLILKKCKIIKVFYPIFPPDKHVFEILKWLKNNSIK